MAVLDSEGLAAESYRDLAEQHILILQDQIEAQVALLHRHRQKLLQEAGEGDERKAPLLSIVQCNLNRKLFTCTGTPKQRDRFNKKIRADNKSIDATLQQYNELVPWGCQSRQRAQLDDLTGSPARFPWANESATGEPAFRNASGARPLHVRIGQTSICAGSLAALRPHGVYTAFGLCDASNRVRRCQEESTLLRKEMQQYLSYFAGALEKIQAAVCISVLEAVSLLPSHRCTGVLTQSECHADLREVGRSGCRATVSGQTGSARGFSPTAPHHVGAWREALRKLAQWHTQRISSHPHNRASSSAATGGL